MTVSGCCAAPWAEQTSAASTPRSSLINGVIVAIPRFGVQVTGHPDPYPCVCAPGLGTFSTIDFIWDPIEHESCQLPHLRSRGSAASHFVLP